MMTRRSVYVRQLLKAALAVSTLAVLLLAGGTRSSSALSSDERWIWPITPTRVVQGFHPPAERWHSGHRGVDLRATPGQAVRAPSAGLVRFAGVVVDRPVLSLVIAGVVVTLEPVESALLEGASVAAGDSIGTVGTGGHCESTCVHVGVVQGETYESPLHYFQRPVVRLLPQFLG